MEAYYLRCRSKISTVLSWTWNNAWKAKDEISVEHGHIVYMSQIKLRILFIILLTFILSYGSAYCSGSSPKGIEEMRVKYHEVEAQLMKNTLGIPLHVESIEENNTMCGDVYGLIDHPFDTVRRILGVSANWCDIMSLHLNVKACTYRKLNHRYLLTLYCGRKFYQPPGDTYEIPYEYRITSQQRGYIQILLTADRGPLDTKNYQIKVEAIPLDKHRTFIHFSYGYSYGKLLSVAMKTYFATLGRGKIGFSVESTDEQNNPVYVDGIRGVIERNSVRYYLAIQSYMDTLKFPPEKRFEKRISTWYDLIDKFKKHLFEMKKEEYLQYKKQERLNQLMLQNELSR